MSGRERDQRPNINQSASILRHIREREGLSKRAVAKATGVHETLVGKIETGDRKPSIKLALNAARIPGVTPEETAILIRNGLKEALDLDDQTLDDIISTISDQRVREHDYGYKSESSSNGDLVISYHLSSPAANVQQPELEVYEKMVGLELVSVLSSINRLRELRNTRQKRLKKQDVIFIPKDHQA